MECGPGRGVPGHANLLDGRQRTARPWPLAVEKRHRRGISAFATAPAAAVAASAVGEFGGACRAEVLLVEAVGLGESLPQTRSVVKATEAEIREVVEEAVEDALGVIPVLRRVEDVGVPHLVDLARWRDALARVEQVEDEELAVLGRVVIGLRQRHLGQLIAIGGGELEDDGLEIQRSDQLHLLFLDCRGIHGYPYLSEAPDDFRNSSILAYLVHV
jgi:hypothetical protein